MACATLKRSLDWEPVLGSRPAKRRRCGAPFCGGSPTQQKEHRTSPTLTTTPPPAIQRPQQFRHSFGGPLTTTISSTPPKPKSIFPDVLSKKLTPEYMAENIRAELRRLHKHNKLQQQTASTEAGTSTSTIENTPPKPPSRSERALFTFKQVGLICERMLKERESEIREEYDNVLTAKLAEQYEAFVKFTYDQIHKNYASGSVPSYLS